jgi:hypothetical protein
MTTTKFLRKAAVAERYGLTIRSVERMVEDGRIPGPALYRGRCPLWSLEELEKDERAARTRLTKQAASKEPRAAA